MNRIITNPTYCTRTHALSIRMNLSYIEEWMNDNSTQMTQDSEGLIKHLNPVIQMTQFLQGVSSLKDVIALQDVLSTLDSISIVHIHWVMQSYRFEIGEEPFSNAIEQYIQDLYEKKKQSSPTRYAPDEEVGLIGIIDTSFMLPFKIPQVGGIDPNWPGSKYAPLLTNEVLNHLDPTFASDVTMIPMHD